MSSTESESPQRPRAHCREWLPQRTRPIEGDIDSWEMATGFLTCRMSFGFSDADPERYRRVERCKEIASQMQRGDSDATQEEWTMLSWEVPFTDRMRRRLHLPVESDRPTPYMGVAGPIRSPFRSSRPRLRVSLPGPSPQSVFSRPSGSSSVSTAVTTETVTLTRCVHCGTLWS